MGCDVLRDDDGTINLLQNKTVGELDRQMLRDVISDGKDCQVTEQHDMLYHLVIGKCCSSGGFPRPSFSGVPPLIDTISAI